MKSDKRVIKRYANRKLYDTKSSKYVTLREVASIIKAGDDVRIIGNETGEDITAVTLAQIIMEEEKSLGGSHTNLLRKIIQSGGETLSSFITQSVQPQIKALREEAGKNIDFITSKGRFTIQDTRKAFKDFTFLAQKSFDDLQKRIDKRIDTAMSTVPTLKLVQNEMTLLQEKVRSLELRLKSLKKEIKNS